MTSLYRDTHAAMLDRTAVGSTVRLAGWVARRRDHGGVIFIDLRDASGIVQVVLNPEDGPADEDLLHGLRVEYCVAVDGEVRERPEGTVNPDLATGEIEVVASKLMLLSPADPLPFQLDERVDVDENRRLEYRFLDLRRPRMAANLAARATAMRAMRAVLDEAGFLEVETPTLIASTPEGARDFLVPSRHRPGRFFALPQSPQLFKQLLMVGGVERYYQFARCYRDEDLRADRQFEFTQLDLEGAFWGEDDVLRTLEDVAVAAVRAVRGIELERPFPRLTFSEAMARYGTDKPDLRFGMEIVDCGEVFAGTGFKAFAGVLAGGGVIRAINAGKLGLSRSGLDGLVSRAQELGAQGLVWMVHEDDGSLRAPISKFLSTTEVSGLQAKLDSAAGDTLLVVAGDEAVVSRVLGQLRVELGQPDGQDELVFAFIVDFPVFDVTEEGELVPAHHPFTAPRSVADMEANPETAVSQAYDMVLNGWELGSGSVRIHDPAVQAKVFEILGIDEASAQRRFGWFMDALRFGTPPHAGFAIGFDRLVAILQGEPNIREVIPFPKTQTGADPLTGSPSRVDDAQLRDVGLRIAPEVLAQWAEDSAE